ncbi:hypothetical protein [Ochrobactrum soli]|uniref:hypothetical protein n=1 Tax=Ochrobactrum soli TaxID=2448455 RepID=UPI000D69FE5D|nr:hypothetical protein [[Ochrobactrum] soli]
MEKSAHPAALATRLNNLEQKFEEVHDDDLLVALNFLYSRALLGSEKNTGSGLSDKFWENPNLFDDDFSFAMAVFGSGLENFQIYEAQKKLNFYNRVFGSAINFENVGGVLPLSHALFMNVGKAFTSEWNDKSLTETIFGSDSNISYIQEKSSLFDKIFGSSAESLQVGESLFDKISKILGTGDEYLDGTSLFNKVFGDSSTIDVYLDEISGTVTRSNFLSAVQRFRSDFDTYKTNVDNRLASLSQRISALEAQL